MTSHVGRLYAAVAAVLVFFVLWAVIAAHPWKATRKTTDPRLVALAQREQLLRREAVLVQQIVAQRAAAARRARAQLASAHAAQARAQLASAQAPAAPSVRVVTLPPLTITRTS
jgi:predicted lipid-binding transport protein (Tim44 family)